MYDIIVFYMIYDMISYMISVRLQLPILTRHSALMQTMVGMSVMLTWTEKWMPTRSVTMLTKTPSQTVRHGHGGRCRDSCDTFEAQSVTNDIICDIIYDFLLQTGLHGGTDALPQQSSPGGIFQRQA